MDKESFLENADKYKDTIYRIALNYLRNTYDADDIVQEVLIKLYTSKQQFEAASISFEQREQSELFMSVMSLPEKNRIVLYLFYYEGFSVKKIAGIGDFYSSLKTADEKF